MPPRLVFLFDDDLQRSAVAEETQQTTAAGQLAYVMANAPTISPQTVGQAVAYVLESEHSFSAARVSSEGITAREESELRGWQASFQPDLLLDPAAIRAAYHVIEYAFYRGWNEQTLTIALACIDRERERERTVEGHRTSEDLTEALLGPRLAASTVEPQIPIIDTPIEPMAPCAAMSA